MPLPENPTDHERHTARLESAGFVTGNCFCTRAVFECVGGFDTRFRTAWREDSDLFFKLLEAGADIIYAMDAIVVHPVRPVQPAPWGVSLRAERRHVFDALLYKKHPRLYAQYIRPDRPLLYYAIIAALVVVVVGVGVDALAITATGLIAWCCLTGALIVRRLRTTNRSRAHVLEVVVTSLVIPVLSIYHRVRGGVAYRVAFW